VPPEAAGPAAAPALRVAFAGTPPFAAEALQAIADAGFAIALVLTQPDRPAGRGLKLQASAVKTLAQRRGLAVAQPRSLKLDGRWPDDARTARDTLAGAAPDVLVVAAYGLILPEWVLTLPHLGCINIHASLLPRWRGAAPIQRAIEAGDAETGITIMQMDAGLDTGDILCLHRLPIAPDDTAARLTDRLARLGAAAIVAALQALQRGPLAHTPQPAAGVTYAAKIDKAEAAIDWRHPAVAIERRVRAFDPAPGAGFACGAEIVKLWRAGVVPAVGTPPGRVLDLGAGRRGVACGEGALELLELQRPGGRRQPAAPLLPGLAGAGLRPGADLPLPG
jgi:methionyl-tRNA formyltransferase